MTTTIRPPAQAGPIPGPSGHPLLGMAPALRRDLLGAVLDGFHRYGDVVRYRFGPGFGPALVEREAIAVHHPDAVRQVFTNGKVFTRRTVPFGVLAELLGDGLLTSDGDVWMRQRRTLQPLFTPRRVAGYTDLMAAEAQRVAAEPTGDVVDLHQLMQRYTLRVVGRALFGDEVDDVIPDLQRLVPLAGDVTLARTMQLVRLPLRVGTVRNRRFSRASAELYAIIDRILARREARDGTPAAGADDGDDLLSRLHAARDPETGQPLSRQELRDQALVFFLAGHETTAGALTFTLHQLGRHPDIQEQVAADPNLVKPALLEGMRLYPPAYSTERRVATDTELGGYRLRAGAPVVVSAWVTHRHPAYWPEPERYDPWRFVGEHDRPRYAYFPFGGGPRSCIGEQFALLEGTVLLESLLARYRIESLDPVPKIVPLITLRPAEPVRATLRYRS